jgi:hypothetical protein
MQHELVERYHLKSHSFGEEPLRRLRIFPAWCFTWSQTRGVIFFWLNFSWCWYRYPQGTPMTAVLLNTTVAF